MPRTSRASRGGFVYHILNRGNGHSDVFHKDDDFAAFVSLMREAHEKVPMRLTGFCLMTNHFHLVLWPHEETPKVSGTVFARAAGKTRKWTFNSCQKNAVSFGRPSPLTRNDDRPYPVPPARRLQSGAATDELRFYRNAVVSHSPGLAEHPPAAAFGLLWDTDSLNRVSETRTPPGKLLTYS